MANQTRDTFEELTLENSYLNVYTIILFYYKLCKIESKDVNDYPNHLLSCLAYNYHIRTDHWNEQEKSQIH